MRTRPRSFRGEGAGDDRHSTLYEYDYAPPSMLEQHKVLAVVFCLVFLGLALYLYFSTHVPLTFAPTPQPVYIQAVTPHETAGPSQPEPLSVAPEAPAHP